MSLYTTTSQTVGPYLHIGMTWLNSNNLVGEGVSGEPLTISGCLLDGHGDPISDGLIEIWQANAAGKYNHPEDTQDKAVETGFLGFGRIPTDAQGGFHFSTIKPGRVPGPNDELQAPHLVVSVFGRGILKRLATRMYFANDAANTDDPILKLVPTQRHATLMAQAVGEGELQWNIIVQGENETVFFDV
ncbi:MAG: protocatechuate 3,4-dioxygenase subunit alpha [Gammaproteobacteria bacterium]